MTGQKSKLSGLLITLTMTLLGNPQETEDKKVKISIRCVSDPSACQHPGVCLIAPGNLVPWAGWRSVLGSSSGDLQPWQQQYTNLLSSSPIHQDPVPSLFLSSPKSSCCPGVSAVPWGLMQGLHAARQEGRQWAGGRSWVQKLSRVGSQLK